MAKWDVTKYAEQYLRQLDELGAKSKYMIGRAVYPAAGLVADAIAKNIGMIPIVKRGERGSPEHPLVGITAAQKQGLAEGFGISRMIDDNGFYDVKLGFEGYNSQHLDSKHNGIKIIHGKEWTQWQANAMIARSLEAGTSFRKKQPFVAPAVRKTKKHAEEIIRKRLDEEIAKIFR